MNNTNSLKIRWFYLAAGVFAMLFSGVLYAWSILKTPFSENFGWSNSLLALNFTLTMCFFCLGAFAGSLIAKKIGHKATLIIAGVLVGAGFTATGLLRADIPHMLFLSYAVLAGSGIGISYNVVISTVNSWFPDKKGLCSGCLMMGFGVSTLLMGEVINKLFRAPSFGAGKTFILLGAVIAIVIIISGIIIKKPSPYTVFPDTKEAKTALKEDFEIRDYTPTEMLKSISFWKAFICIVFIAALGNSVISFAKDFALSVNATASLATTLVGVLSVFNGIGRILTGALYDALGRKTTMVAANALTIVAALMCLASVYASSLPLCIIAICLTGLSYGSCPTITSAFTASFYGRKHFATNYSINNFNLIFASFIANASNLLLVNTGCYFAPFLMLLILSVLSLILNLTIKKP
ncbi:MAG: MFS transporter [Clostridia bacterium]|nr:MFS transporter [Clostridia bacterium]